MRAVLPKRTAYCEGHARYHTVKDMLAIMDAGLKVMNDDSDSMTVERGILLNTESRAEQGYPIPCVLLFKEE
jgi:hypothetical protein